MRHDERPEPTRTYQGRALPRPADEVVDQGLGFDLGTLLGRRQLLRAFGLGVGTVGLAACGRAADSDPASSDPAPSASSAATTTTNAAPGGSAEIPDETAGPFPGDGSNGPDVLAQSGIVRSDLRTSFGTGGGTAEGVPMILELTVQDLANGGRPFAGTAVYVWHCDREGRYSMYSDGVTDQNYLRGVQIADAQGRVRFTSVFPACYDGRWPHVHFEVYPGRSDLTDAGKAIATSQVALPQDTCSTVYAQPGYQASVANLARVSLRSDLVFGDDAGAHQLGTVTGDVSRGYTVALAVPVDTTTAPTVSRPGGRIAG